MPEVVPLKAPLGARIEGLDRARANQPAIGALLNHALAEHLLVVVPGERLAPAETRRFAGPSAGRGSSCCATSTAARRRTCRSW